MIPGHKNLWGSASQHANCEASQISCAHKAWNALSYSVHGNERLLVSLEDWCPALVCPKLPSSGIAWRKNCGYWAKVRLAPIILSPIHVLGKRPWRDMDESFRLAGSKVWVSGRIAHLGFAYQRKKLLQMTKNGFLWLPLWCSVSCRAQWAIAGEVWVISTLPALLPYLWFPIFAIFLWPTLKQSLVLNTCMISSFLLPRCCQDIVIHGKLQTEICPSKSSIAVIVCYFARVIAKTGINLPRWFCLSRETRLAWLGLAQAIRLWLFVKVSRAQDVDLKVKKDSIMYLYHA